jgi:hypothetical protein
MPYSGADDPNIPKTIPAGKRAQWAAVWNSTYAACQKAGGKDCEARAFRTANGVIKEQTEEQSMAKTSIFVEQVELVEGTLNRDNREVEVVLIRPGWSTNGRYYAPGVLAKAAPLYENSRAFANHPTPDQIKRGEGRDVTDLTGRFYNVRIGEAGELRAVRKVYDNPAGNAVWPAIVDAIESKTQVIGLSINAVGKAAQGTGPDGKDGVIVEEISAVASVDDVIAPAAGGGFERLIMGADDLLAAVLEHCSYEEFIAARPDYVETIRTQLKRARQDDAVRAAYQERDEAQSALLAAQQEIAQLKEQAEHHRTIANNTRAEKARAELAVTLEKALREARLTPVWEQELRQQLNETAPDQWPDVIARHRRLAQDAGLKSVVPVEGSPRLTEGVVVSTQPAGDDLLPREGEDNVAWARRIGALSGKG